MLTLHAHCDRFDLAAVYGPVLPPMWMLLQHQATAGPSFAFRTEEATVAVGGYVPWAAAGCWELWFHATPEAAPHMVLLIRLARLTLAALPHSDPRPVEAAVVTPAGARLAHALGLRPVGAAHGIEVWRSVCRDC